MCRLFLTFVAFMSLSINAMAQAVAAQTAAAAQPPAYLQFVPLIAVFAVMYFLMIRPQMKKQKDHQAFVTKLSRGDEIVTTSGILGRIEGLTDTFVTLEISPNVRIKVLRSAVAGSAKAAVTTSQEVTA